MSAILENVEEAKQLHNEAEWARKHPIRIQQIQDIDDLLCF